MKNYSLNDYFTTIYSKMFMGLSLTALVAYLIPYLFPTLFLSLLNNYKVIAIVCALVEIGLVIFIGSLMKNKNKNVTPWFYIYSVVNGITLSFIFGVINPYIVGMTFLVTAFVFGAFALIGITTKKDLSAIGKFAIALLLGLIFATLVNVFIQSSMLDYVISYAGVVIFSGLIAYDNQKIKNSYENSALHDNYNNITTWFALDLYLDFINLFINILNLMNKLNN